MSRFVRICTAAAAISTWTSVAAAQTCKQQNLSLTFGSITFLDPAPPPYDMCVVAPVVGTLRGTILSCLRFADMYGSDAIWHDGEANFAVARWDDTIRTPDGDITIVERGMVDLATGLQATMMQVTGGTGRYAGASGVLTASAEWPKRLTGFGIQGVICTR